MEEEVLLLRQGSGQQHLLVECTESLVSTSQDQVPGIAHFGALPSG
jgi:hypothetical protein